MPIDIKAEVEKLQTMYKSDPLQGVARILLVGESGSGKSFLMRTAPKPVHVDSFDPGGTKGLKDLILSGDIIADTRFEKENPKSPDAFAIWKDKTDERINNGYFDNFGTYVLDSATTWTNAILDYIQKKRGAPESVPEWNKDYHPQKIFINNYIKKLMTLPCHVIVTGHLDIQKDSEGNVIARRFMLTGKGAITIPLLFDELWVSEVKGTGNKAEYMVRTQSSGMYLARTRLGALGRLDPKEPANLKNIFKKVGLNYEDKSKII